MFLLMNIHKFKSILSMRESYVFRVPTGKVNLSF